MVAVDIDAVMKGRTLAITLIVLLLTAGLLAYFRPWAARISVLYPRELSDAFEKIKAEFEGGNWLVSVELKPYGDVKSLETLLAGGADIIVADRFEVMRDLYEGGRIGWAVKFANRSITCYYASVVESSVHPQQSLSFIRFILENPDVWRGLNLTPIIPAEGFWKTPVELRHHLAKFKVIIDWFNRTVFVPEKVSRVVSLVPVITISIIEMKSADLLVGVDRITPTSEFLRIIYPKIKEIPVVGLLSEFDEETIVGLRPDVILAGHITVAERFEDLGIPVVVIPTGDLRYSQVLEAIRLIGEVIGREEEAEELISYCKGIMEELLNVTSGLSRNERPKVYIAMGDGLKTHVSTLSKDAIWLAGGLDAAENISRPSGGPPIAAVSMESVLKWNPDIIIAWSPKVKSIILSDPRWKAIRAVKDGRVYVLPRGVREWIIPEAEAFLGAKWLAAKLYPDRFSFSKSDIKEFYVKFLDYEPSDEQIDRILSGKYVTKIPGV